MRNRPTREMIVQLASRLYIEQGFSATDNKEVARQLGISTGNLTFHFPTKEHLLTELVKELCAFQRRMIDLHANEDRSPLLALCIEFATMTAAAEENAAIRDVYVSAYTYPMSLAVIRENDGAKTKEIFGKFCSDWTDERFAAAECLYSGIEYGTFSSVGKTDLPLDLRVECGLDAILRIYQVPEEIRLQKIQKIMDMDYKKLGSRILTEFRDYVTAVNWQAVETARKNRMKKTSNTSGNNSNT
ncbi:MAG: TetR/AcrR family transcriptional regulator [Oscillospiraceae bacterium]|nr:TetR/AcrR family transcriptional regulator [Oscillospiraceae bacterium]